MKICDRCAPKVVPTVETFTLSVEGSRIDLCEKCKNEVLAFIHNDVQEGALRSILKIGKRNSARADA